MSFRVTWTIPPSAQLIPNLTSYERQVMEGVWMIGDLFGAKMAGEAKAGAPWNDQTGAARQGLRGDVAKAATSVIIYLIHSVHYGVYLEMGTSKMAPRPIILPTLQANYGPIMDAVRALLA
jgi:hypothetical protein